jgi:hypothetical protein
MFSVLWDITPCRDAKVSEGPNASIFTHDTLISVNQIARCDILEDSNRQFIVVRNENLIMAPYCKSRVTHE